MTEEETNIIAIIPDSGIGLIDIGHQYSSIQRVALPSEKMVCSAIRNGLRLKVIEEFSSGSYSLTNHWKILRAELIESEGCFEVACEELASQICKIGSNESQPVT